MSTASVYTVSQVNSYIKGMFVQDFLLSGLCVRGEVSNLKYHTSGHVYFTLKDEGGSIAAVMFAGSRRGLAFPMQNGQKVLVTGQINVYEREGRYQLYARQIELDGLGELYRRFVECRERLAERGMFAAEYKRAIPSFVRVLGVVTAPTGAAIRDIINVAHRRNPYVQIILSPAQVQGEGAPESIAAAIERLDRLHPDCMIVGRGGGSLEDLWAFNEEIVAQAIFDCDTPVISAVGHETDTTIADYVADMRAPTPSAAAELAVYDCRAFLDSLREKRALLIRRMADRLSWERERLRSGQLRLRLYRPEYRIASLRQSLIDMEERLRTIMEHRLEGERHRLGLLASRLEAMSPLKRLGGGYAYVTDESGRGVLSASQVHGGERLNVHVRDGSFVVRVEENRDTEA